MISRERTRWLSALLVVALVMAATYLCSDVVFQTNDDNGIVVAASGGVTGEPYAGNGLTSYLYGALLSGLYGLFSGLPWHSVILTAAQILSLIAILRSLFYICHQKHIHMLWGIVAFLGLYVGIGVKFMVRLQFTATPGYCAAALAALLWTLPEGRRARRFACGIGFGLMAFALLLRFKGGLLVLPVPLMMGAVKVIKKDRASKSIILVLAASLIFAGLSYGADQILYRINEKGWEEQAAFDEASAILLDYNNTDEAYALAEKVTDWSPELIRCIRNWNLLIDERFNTKNLTALAQAIEAHQTPPAIFEVIKKTGSIIRRYQEFAWNALAFALLGLAAFISFIRARRGWDTLLLIGLAGSMAAVIAWFYGIQNRLPDRVAFAYAWPVYVAALLVMTEALPCDCPAGRRGASIGAVLLMLAGSVTLGLNLSDTLVLPSESATRSTRAALTMQANAYAADHPDTLYVTDVGQAFYAFSTDRPPVNLLEWGNAMVRSPMYRVKLDKLGYPQGFTTRNLADETVRLLFADDRSLQWLMACVNADIAPWQAILEEDMGMFKIYRLE